MPRAKKPGGSGNRTDLLAAPTQPIQVATGLPYGQHQQLAQEQAAVPLGGGPINPVAQAMPAAQEHNFTPVDLFGPTNRPNEPVTAGLSVGPGPGPEVLHGPSSKPSDTFDMLALQTGDPAMADLAQAARVRGF